MFTFGYVAIVGRTNAGKSTLLNTIIGEKVAIVSPKPQTTRDNIIGVYTKGNTQIAFVDTPGIHTSKNNLDRFMAKNIRSALSGVDAVVFVFDGSKQFVKEDIDYVSNISKEIDTFIVISKIDVAKFEKVYPKIEELKKIESIKDIIPVSSFGNKNIDVLLSELEKVLPSSETKNFAFEEDEYTDKSVRYLTAEIIREKLLQNLNDEIPHGVAVVVTKFEEEKNLTRISGEIMCEKDSHKNIIIGKSGSMLKKILSSAREDIEKMLSTKVMLEVWVKVKKNWRDNIEELNEFGYTQKNI